MAGKAAVPQRDRRRCAATPSNR